MITVGVDFAAEPVTTAMATVEWSVGAASVTALEVQVEDASVIASAAGAAKLGLDCPLGWPDSFVTFLDHHHTGHVVRPEAVSGKDWRRKLAYRETDRAVRSATGLTPLSVATDRIGLTAMRAASLLGQLATAGQPADRAGTGVVVEVYPAASLRCWGFPHRGYKGTKNLETRRALMGRLAAAAPWLDLGGHARACIDSDDALDAVIAALTARAAVLGHVTTPGDHLAQARREGWIALPACTIGELVVTSGTGRS